jgi:hypothetical protein
MEPVVIVTIETDKTVETYELGEESDKDILSLIRRLGNQTAFTEKVE